MFPELTAENWVELKGLGVTEQIALSWQVQVVSLVQRGRRRVFVHEDDHARAVGFLSSGIQNLD